jgi:ribosomal protein L37E
MDNSKIKICKRCGSDTNKFLIHRHTCTKCLSSENNIRLNKNNYYDTYYQENKEKVLLQQRERYRMKKELLKEENKKTLVIL